MPLSRHQYVYNPYKVWFRTYLRKMRGMAHSNSRPQVREAVVTFCCCFAGVGVLGALVQLHLGSMEGLMLIPSFGASSLMVFGAPLSPFAQPRNVVGGHILSALCGVFAYNMFGAGWPAAALAVALAGALMHLTSTLHPPGGATALLAVIGDPRIIHQGYSYAFMPVGVGMMIIVVLAVILNNLVLHRQYPTHWR